MFGKELVDAYKNLGALDKRTEDVAKSLEKISGKIESLLDRLARLETKVELLQESVRNSILADIKADIVLTQVRVNQATKTLIQPNGDA